MSVFFEGNAFIDGGQLQNANVTSCTVSNSAINTSSLDMNMQNITSVLDPIQPQDAATKKYVDDLGIVINDYLISGTVETEISNTMYGTYTLTIKKRENDGPTAIFNISKIDQNSPAHIVRTVGTPGISIDTRVMLLLKWLPNENIKIYKTHSSFDGLYTVKLM